MSSENAESLAILKRLEPVLTVVVNAIEELRSGLADVRSEQVVMRTQIARMDARLEQLAKSQDDTRVDIARMDGRLMEMSNRISDLNGRLPVAIGLHRPPSQPDAAE